MKTILIHNTKGGIGKTTITKAIAEVLASQNKKILIIDCDGQGNITENYGLNKTKSYSKHWFVRKNKNEVIKYVTEFLPKTIESTFNSNIDVVSGGRDIYKEIKNIDSQDAPDKVLGLNIMLFNEKSKMKYDYIFIDLNPSWDILSLNSYLAADSIISIIDRTEYALSSLIDNINEWENRAYNYSVENKLNAIILNRLKADKMSKEILKTVNEVEYLNKIKTINFIPESANIEKSVVTGGRSITDIKSFDNWKPSKAFAKWLKDNNISYNEGNFFNNLVAELIDRGVL